MSKTSAAKLVVTLVALAATGAAAQQSAGVLQPLSRSESSMDRAERIRSILEQQSDASTLSQDVSNTYVPPLLSDNELDRLVAPVALYPDPLLAQVLVASSFPEGVVQANRLLAESDGMTDAQLGDALREQTWDPSVVVLLSGFPTVIERMASDSDWTQSMGEAVLNQEDDVLDAVQRMRWEAKTAGNLKSNQAQTVETEDDKIYIRPADPTVVYVPSYDPVTTYSTKNVRYSSYGNSTVPYYGGMSAPYASNPTTGLGSYLTNPLVAGAIGFGSGLLVNQLFNDDNEDNDNDRNKGWDDYWGQQRTIDWNDRRFYPRSQYVAGQGRYAWEQERDRYWDRNTQRWRGDAVSDRARIEERRDALRWLDQKADRREQRLRTLRERQRDAEQAAIRQQRAIERARSEARAAELEAARIRETRLEREKRIDARQEERARAARQEQRRQQRAESEKQQRQADRAQAGAFVPVPDPKSSDRKADDARKGPIDMKQALKEDRARAERQAERDNRQAERRKQETDAGKKKARKDQKAWEEKAQKEKARRQRAQKEKSEDKRLAAKRDQGKKPSQGKTQDKGRMQDTGKSAKTSSQAPGLKVVAGNDKDGKGSGKKRKACKNDDKSAGCKK